MFNRPLTKASDLYSLGATAIALLTNTPSAQVSNLIDNNYKFQFGHLSHLATINPDLIDWLKTMVAPNLDDRFDTAQSALDALQPIDPKAKAPSEKAQNKGLNLNYVAIASTFISSMLLLGGVLVFFGTGFFTLRNEPQPKSKFKLDPKSKPEPKTVKQSSSAAEQWFTEIKSRCNAIEVMPAMRRTKHPDTTQGVGYAASCYALAGKLNLAERKIQELDPNLRPEAAEVVFGVALPIASTEENISIGAMMELVLKYLPENTLALYHAGMSAYIWDEHPKAEKHLNKFLQLDQNKDGREIEVQATLKRIAQNIPANDGYGGHEYIDSAN